MSEEHESYPSFAKWMAGYDDLLRERIKERGFTPEFEVCREELGYLDRERYTEDQLLDIDNLSEAVGCRLQLETADSEGDIEGMNRLLDRLELYLYRLDWCPLKQANPKVPPKQTIPIPEVAELAQRFKEARHSARHTQVTAAEQVRLSETSIKRFEQGKRKKIRPGNRQQIEQYIREHSKSPVKAP